MPNSLHLQQAPTGQQTNRYTIPPHTPKPLTTPTTNPYETHSQHTASPTTHPTHDAPTPRPSRTTAPTKAPPPTPTTHALNAPHPQPKRNHTPPPTASSPENPAPSNSDTISQTPHTAAGRSAQSTPPASPRPHRSVQRVCLEHPTPPFPVRVRTRHQLLQHLPLGAVGWIPSRLQIPKQRVAACELDAEAPEG
jgi:hypothetical protein